MNTFNSVMSTAFGSLLGWFGSASAWIDIMFWSIAGGIVALLVYKLVSNQKGIEKSKNDIKVHLLEIRLFQDDLLGVVVSTGKILFKNLLYIGHNVLPMLVMFVPMMAILFQLEASYAFDPLQPGATEMLKLKLDPAHTQASALDVGLELPAGVSLVSGPARIVSSGEVAWKIRADEPGDHVLKIHVGDQVVEKGLAVGGAARRVPVMRTKSWEGYLYPGEDMLPSDAPVADVRVKYPERSIPWLPDGEMGILMDFFLISIAAGLALKGVFGVTL